MATLGIAFCFLALGCLCLPSIWLSSHPSLWGNRQCPGVLDFLLCRPGMCNHSQSFHNICSGVIKVNTEESALLWRREHSFWVEWSTCLFLFHFRHLQEPSCSVIDAPLFLSLRSLRSKSTNRLFPERQDASVIFSKWAHKYRFFGERCI